MNKFQWNSNCNSNIFIQEKKYLRMSSGKYRLFCLGLSVLRASNEMHISVLSRKWSLLKRVSCVRIILLHNLHQRNAKQNDICYDMTICARSRYPVYAVGCNYLSLPLIPASGTQVVISSSPFTYIIYERSSLAVLKVCPASVVLWNYLMILLK